MTEVAEPAPEPRTFPKRKVLLLSFYINMVFYDYCREHTSKGPGFMGNLLPVVSEDSVEGREEDSSGRKVDQDDYI